MIGGKLLSASAAVQPTYIEDVFSTYLYKGTDAAVTITNGIDLAGEGGLVWVKARSEATSHCLQDTLRGTGFRLLSNTNDGNTSTTSHITAFNNNGFTVGTSLSNGFSGGQTYASWTFRQAPRFFDVVTYTGDGTNRAIFHNLGVVPGCVMVKRTDSTSDWFVTHRSLLHPAETLYLNSTAAKTNTTVFNATVGGPSPMVNLSAIAFGVTSTGGANTSGATYVAYLFAHDPLGPSGDGSDGLIACGSYTGNGSATGPTVSLGWEPQWLLVKKSDSVGGYSTSWMLLDNMRGMTAVSANDTFLVPNTSDQEGFDSGTSLGGDLIAVQPTGFQVKSVNGRFNESGSTYIYIAIRRGPMREPTVGTQVFAPVTSTSTQGTKITTGFPVDMQMITWRTNSVSTNTTIVDRLRGVSTNTSAGTFARLITSKTDAEDNSAVTNEWDNTGFRTSGAYASISTMYQNFRRAPGFFDVVAYTGTGVARTINHNLGVAPELIITKSRSGTTPWNTYVSSLGADKYLTVNTQNAVDTNTGYWNNTSPTSSVFSVGASTQTNNSGATYISYLFASLPGISKVGSYTGNGSTQTINCGFTTGARFILIKRTDSTGDWYVWDTARGIVSGNDPHLSLNTTAAEVTSDDTIDPDNSGFIVNQVSATNVNVNAASYIYLAIA